MKKIIRYLAAILCLTMLLPMGAALAAEEPEEKSLYAQGLEIIALMVEMAQSEEIIGAYTANEEVQSAAQSIAESDFSQPKAVYSIASLEQCLSELTDLLPLGDISEELREVITKRAIGSIMSMLNGMGGVDMILVASVCTVSKAFVNTDAAEDIIYIYTFENAVPVAVTFITGEDGAVYATGTFILNEDFTCGSVQELEDAFEGVELDIAEVEMA